MFQGLFQPMHLFIILVIVLIVFGPGKLPELGSSIGKAIRGFKKAMDEPDEKSGNISETKKIEEKKEFTFGPGTGKLPDVGSSLGNAIRGFKKAMDEPDEKSGNISETKKIEEKKE